MTAASPQPYPIAMDTAPAPALPQSFGALLAPFDREQFLAEHYGRRALHLPGPAQRFERLLGWQGLDELLAQTSLWSNHSVAMAMAGQPLTPDQFCLWGKNRLGDRVRVPDHAKVADLLRQGATLVVDFIDRLDPGVRAVAEVLEAVLLAPVTASAFISWQRQQGYPVHFDTQEVFALQVAGRKAWRLYTGRFEHPAELKGYRANDLDPETKRAALGQVETRIELAPGDLLYVPAGQFHEALALDEASLHVSFGVMRPIAHDFLSTLLEALPADPAFRKPLPAGDDPAQHATWLADLAQRLGAAIASPARAQELAQFQRARAFERWGGLTVRDRRVVRRFRVRWLGARLSGQRLTLPDRPPTTLSPEAAKLALWTLPQDLIDERRLVAAV
ncbi:MAG TPA: cupin domain-containing protein, partial [Kiloniellales bacterium]|nr:cupin domain-containing protein [Kiloniellales bacterium]